MNSDRMGQKILQSVSIVVERAIKTAGYDKTVQATIVSCADESIGKYRVRYQGGIWYAFSSSPDVSYRENDSVYVLVPNGNMDKQKTILGTTDQLGQNFVSIVQDRDNYNQIGDNLIQFKQGYNGSYGLISRKRIQDSQGSYSYQDSSIILYEYGGANNHIAQSPNRINNYLKNADNFLLSMDIQTDLADSQIGIGNYGLKVELTFNDNETGNEIIREYVLDTQDMVGDRYNYLMPTEQSAIFNFDKENFVRVNKVSLFTESFNSYSTEEDIFISNLQFIALQALTQEEKEGVNFKINFPKGFIFTSRPKTNSTGETTGEVIYTAEAHFRVQMREVDVKNQNLKFYWFRENPRIQAQHKTYSSYAGPGWTCLNPQSDGSSKDKFKQLSPKNVLEISNGTVLGEECHFKCVAIYNEQIFSKEFVFKQTDSLYKISISSTNGFEFTNDIGSTKLTCNLNNSSNNINYQWCKYDSQGKYQSIQNATSSNITVQIKSIVNFATYKCAIYDQNNIFLAAASVKLINKIGTEGTYSIVLNNADAMYVYNENGVAPTNQSMEKPQQVSTLSLIVYNDKGEEIPKNVLTSSKTNLEWHIPKIDTLIKIDPNYKNFKNKIQKGLGENDTEYIIKNVTEVPYTIEDRYDIRKNKNTINVKIVYAGRVLTAFTNFTFMKQGQPGTNGTDMQIRLVPHVPEGVSKAVFNRTYPMVQIGNDITKMNWTYSNTQDLRVTGSWFDVQMFLSGSQIFNDYRDNQDSSGNPIKVLWSMLRNTGFEWIHSDKVLISTIIGKLTTLINKTTTDDIHLSQDEIRYLNSLESKSQHADLKNIHNDSSKGRASQDYINKLREINFPCFYIDDFQKNFRDKYNTYFNASNEKKNVNFPPVHVLKAEVTRAGKKYFAEMPLISMIYLTDDTKYKAQLKLDSGFRYVIYDTDGTHPSYNNNDPFEINVTGVTSEKISYKYFISGNLTIQKNGISGNKIQLIPKNLYDGSVLNNALMVQIAINNTPKLFLHIPIHFMLNQYGQAALNDWDGVSIKINDEEDSYILAPQIGAGEKGIDNSFTGIMMGKVYTSGSGSKTGLFGYSKGRESIFLNADDGSASFGLPAAGQIKIQPGEDTAYIQGGDYIEDDNNGSGMKMNLSSGNDGPWIRFGSGNFSVDNKGYLTAKGGGSIAGWKIHNTSLYKNSTEDKEDFYIGINSNSNYDSAKSVYKTKIKKPIDGKVETENAVKAFWVNGENGKFEVTHDGYLSIENAVIGSGKKNQIYIGKNSSDENQSAVFSVSHPSLLSENDGFYLGTDGLSLAKDFSVNKDGYLKAKKGEIANWFINDSSFYTEGNSNYFKKSITDRNGMYFGKDGIGILDNFWVDVSQQTVYQEKNNELNRYKKIRDKLLVYYNCWVDYLAKNPQATFNLDIVIEEVQKKQKKDKKIYILTKEEKDELTELEKNTKNGLQEARNKSNLKRISNKYYIPVFEKNIIDPLTEEVKILRKQREKGYLYLKGKIESKSGEIANWTIINDALYSVGNDNNTINKRSEDLKDFEVSIEDILRDYYVNNNGELIKKDDYISEYQKKNIEPYKQPLRKLQLYLKAWKQLQEEYKIKNKQIVYSITKVKAKLKEQDKITDDESRILNKIDSQEEEVRNKKDLSSSRVCEAYVNALKNKILERIRNNKKVFLGVYFGKNGLWLGNNFRVNASGGITATSGKIANWSFNNKYLGWIEESSISNDKFKELDKVAMQLTSSIYQDLIDHSIYFGEKGLRIGNKFYVDNKGNLEGTSVKLSGEIKASSGKIANYWDITENSISHDRKITGDKQKDLEENVGNDSRFGLENKLYFGRRGLSISDVFSVDADGNLKATSAEVKGKITADQGKIAIWNIGDYCLTTKKGIELNISKTILGKLREMKKIYDADPNKNYRNATNNYPQFKLTGPEETYLTGLEKTYPKLEELYNDTKAGKRLQSEYIKFVQELLSPFYHSEETSAGVRYSIPADNDIYIGQSGIRVGQLFYVFREGMSSTYSPPGNDLGGGKIGPWLFSKSGIRTRVCGNNRDKDFGDFIDKDDIFVKKNTENQDFITSIKIKGQDKYVLREGCYFGEKGIRIGDLFVVDTQASFKNKEIKENIEKRTTIKIKLEKYLEAWKNILKENPNAKYNSTTLKAIEEKVKQKEGNNYILSQSQNAILIALETVDGKDTQLGKIKKNSTSSRVDKDYINEFEKSYIKPLVFENNQGYLYLKGRIETSSGRIGNWDIASDYIGWIDPTQENFATFNQTRWDALGDNGVDILNQSNDDPEHTFTSNSKVIKNSIYFGKKGIRMGDYFYVKSPTLIQNKNKTTESNDTLAYFKGKIEASQGKIANWNIGSNELYTGDFGAENSMYFGKSGLSLSNTFKVTEKGELTATSGSIGGWKINDKNISATGITLNKDGTITISGESKLQIGGVTLQAADSGSGASASGGTGLTVSDGHLSKKVTVGDDSQAIRTYVRRNAGEVVVEKLSATYGITVGNADSSKKAVISYFNGHTYFPSTSQIHIAKATAVHITDGDAGANRGKSCTITFGQDGNGGTMKFVNGILVYAIKGNSGIYSVEV